MLDSRLKVATGVGSGVFPVIHIDLFLVNDDEFVGLTNIHTDSRLLPFRQIHINTFKISHGGIGILKLPHLESFTWPFLANSVNNDFDRAMEIIHAYLQSGRDILGCQEALLEAGLKEYARL